MHRVYVSLFFLLLPIELCARDYVRVVGSAAIYPYMAEIVEHFYYDEKQPAPVVEATGTGGGFKAFCAGKSENYPDVVMAARPISQPEKDYCAKHAINDPIEIELGVDAVVLVTFAQPFSLTLAELQTSLSQRIEHWSDVNSYLPKTKVQIMGPPNTAGVYDTFIDLVLNAHQLKLRQDRTYIEVSQESVVVTKLELNPTSLGLISYTFLSQLKNDLKPIHINGVQPSFNTIISGEYPLVRKSYLYVKRESLKRVKSLVPFLRYIMEESVSGEQGYLIHHGFIPLKSKEYQEQQQKIKKILADLRTEQ